MHTCTFTMLFINLHATVPIYMYIPIHTLCFEVRVRYPTCMSLCPQSSASAAVLKLSDLRLGMKKLKVAISNPPKRPEGEGGEAREKVGSSVSAFVPRQARPDTDSNPLWGWLTVKNINLRIGSIWFAFPVTLWKNWELIFGSVSENLILMKISNSRYTCLRTCIYIHSTCTLTVIMMAAIHNVILCAISSSMKTKIIVWPPSQGSQE